MLERSEIIQNRYDKVEKLRENDTDPYVNRFIPTHKSSEILANPDKFIESEEEVTVAGRILTIRSFGKAAFFHIQDQNGQIQVFIKKNEISPEEFSLFKEYLDSGDIVGVKGTIFRTKTEEVTVLARHLTLLTKSTRPLPEKWHGLRDTDTRYRQRYVDLIVNEDVRDAFRIRSKMISACRNFLDGLEYVEVETPMMQPLYGGALARPFTTHHNALGMDLYMRIAPELYLKRLVVGGFHKVYEINRNFRNEGISIRHNPEFTMLELYTAWWNYRDTADLLEKMIKVVVKEVLGTTKITYQGEEIDLDPPGGWKKYSMIDIVNEKLGLNLSWNDPADDVRSKIKGMLDESDGALKEMSVADMIVELFEEKVEDTLVQPTFIMDFPREKSPLAKVRPDDPNVAERFELFIGRLEIANAYSELNDPEEQLERFREQVARRQKGDMEAMCIDEDYIRSLEYGMPPTSGLGVGMDRIAMLFTDSSSIRDVIFFPTLRPETGRPPEEEDGGEEE